MSTLNIENIGGDMTVQGDITAGNKIIQTLQDDGELTSQQAGHVREILQQLEIERQAEKPDPSKVTELLNTIAKVGIPSLLKIVTGLILKTKL